MKIKEHLYLKIIMATSVNKLEDYVNEWLDQIDNKLIKEIKYKIHSEGDSGFKVIVYYAFIHYIST